MWTLSIGFFLNGFCWIHRIQWNVTKHKIGVVARNTPSLAIVIFSDEIVEMNFLLLFLDSYLHFVVIGNRYLPRGSKKYTLYYYYRSGMVNSSTVNSKFHLIRSYCEIFFYHFPNISCLKCTVNSNFHLIRSKILPMNDFELTVPNLYWECNFLQIGSASRNYTYFGVCYVSLNSVNSVTFI